MIKAVIINGGSPLVILGLSGENVTRIAAGEPIFFRGDEIKLPGYDFVIMYGRTEEDIKMEISKLVVKEK